MSPRGIPLPRPGDRPRPTAVLAVAVLAVAVLAACAESSDTPAAPAASALFSCLYGEALTLEAGQTIEARGAEARSVCVDGGGQGAEYLLVPFHFSSSGTSNLSVQISAGGSEPPSAVGGAEASVGTVPETLPAHGFSGGVPQRDWAFHRALREREARELTPRIPTARAAYREGTAGGTEPAAALSTGAPASVAPPGEGDLLELNAGASCNAIDPRTGRVMAVGEHALVVADTTNPAGGFTMEDYERFAATFDTLVYPLNTDHFGERTDLDGSGRTTFFFTRAVNELTPPGAGSFIAGFFWAGDLFPESPGVGLPGCAGSNFREMFYLLVPDPQGETGNVRSTDFVRNITMGVVGHEDQHLINAARRIYITEADGFELTWLNEALSHLAEELLFYATTPLSSGANLSRSQIFGSAEIAEKFSQFAAFNLVNYGIFLESFAEESPLGLDRIPTRGAAWAFLRYLTDHQERPHPMFLRDLVDGPRTGLPNLEDALGTDPMVRLQEWSVANYTDDAVPGVPTVYTQPSWNYRSILQGFGGQEGFPLSARALASGEPVTLVLKGGSGTHLRFGVPPGGRAVLEFSSNGAPAPPSLRWSLVRIH